MITHFGPDHLCPDCDEVFIYWWVGTRGETRCMEVEHCRPHMCAISLQQAEISKTRCPDCRLSVYQYQDQLYDEDAALVRHQCERASQQQPAAVRPPPVKVAPVPARPLPPHVPTL
jgi:hypothetical protein